MLTWELFGDIILTYHFTQSKEHHYFEVGELLFLILLMAQTVVRYMFLPFGMSYLVFKSPILDVVFFSSNRKRLVRFFTSTFIIQSLKYLKYLLRR